MDAWSLATSLFENGWSPWDDDDGDVEPDPAPSAHEALTVTAGAGSWTASAYLDDGEG